MKTRTPEEMETYWGLRDLRTAGDAQLELDVLELGERPAVALMWSEFWKDMGLEPMW